MNNELMRMALSDKRLVSGASRQVVGAAREVVNEVRLAGVEVDGAFALAAHIMEAADRLNAERRSIIGDDPVLAMLLADVQMTAMRQAKSIQSNLYTQW